MSTHSDGLKLHLDTHISAYLSDNQNFHVEHITKSEERLPFVIDIGGFHKTTSHLIYGELHHESHQFHLPEFLC